MTNAMQRFFRLFVLVALLGFAGDLMADSIADMMGEHCAPQSSQSTPSQDKSPCSHCSCAIHNGAVVAVDSVFRMSADLAPTAQWLGVPEPDPTRLAGSIEHPPQLA